MPQPAARARLGVIFLTVLIDLIGFGILVPILPYLAQRFGASGLGLGILMGAYSGMQFLSTLYLGRLSDRIGRRPVLLITMVLNAAGYVLFARAGSYTGLLFARLVSGFASGNIAVAQAYIADITSPAERSRRMGLIGAAFGIGSVTGPALGALAAQLGGGAAPGFVAASLSLINFALAWRILPESLGHEHRIERKLLDLAHIKRTFANPRLRPLLLVWFLAAFSWTGYITVLSLHAEMDWGWNAGDLGIFFVVVGLVTIVMQGWGFGRIVPRTGERRLLIGGAFLMAAGIGAMAFVSWMPAFWAWTLLLAFGNSLYGPAATGLASTLADPSEQGTILGLVQALGALGRLSGPGTFGATFDGAGAEIAFVGTAFAMLLAVFVARLLPRGNLHADSGVSKG